MDEWRAEPEPNPDPIVQPCTESILVPSLPAVWALRRRKCKPFPGHVLRYMAEITICPPGIDSAEEEPGEVVDQKQET